MGTTSGERGGGGGGGGEKRKRHRRRSRSRSRSASPPSSKRHQQQQQQQSRSRSPSQSGGGGGDVTSLSIEETNKLRARLGLKPLEIDEQQSAQSSSKQQQQQQFVHAPAKSLTRERESARVQERTATGRQRREMRDRLGRMRGLGDAGDNDEDGEGEMSASAWIERSRALEAEKRLAERRAKELEELDAEFQISRLVEADQQATGAAASGYSAADLAGLRVAHAAGRFKEGQSTVLVLQDRGVLEDASADGEGEALINVNMVDDERYEENVRNRAQIGSAWHAANFDGGADDDVEQQLEGGKSVLAKYDAVIGSSDSAAAAAKRRSFMLSADGSGVTPTPPPPPSQAASASARASGAAPVSLDQPELRPAADYLTAEELREAAKFKRRKRRVAKARVLKADDLLPLVGEDGEDVGSGAGGSNARPSVTEDGEIPDEPAATKRGLTDAEIIEATPAVADEALEDLQSLLEKARRAKQAAAAAARAQRELVAATVGAAGAARPEHRVLELLTTAKQQEDEDGEAPSNAGIVLDTTAEFCRGLGDASTSATVGAAESTIKTTRRRRTSDAAADVAEDDEDGEGDDGGQRGGQDQEDQDEDFSIYGRGSKQRRVGTWQEVTTASASGRRTAVQPAAADDDDSMDVASDSGAAAAGGGGAGGILEEEPELRKGGVAAALELARRKGYLERDKSHPAGASHFEGLRAKNAIREDVRHDDIDAKFSSSKRDRLSLGHGGGSSGGLQDFKELRNYRPDVKLEYTDEMGRELNAKDAFDYLSHRFHGKGSGKKKTEKRLKKVKEEMLLKSMGSSDTPLGTAEKLHAKLERQGTAFVCLSGKGAAASLPSGVAK